MKKKILIFASVLILASTVLANSSPSLPPPLPLQEETPAASPADEGSFWNKILHFFGFGKGTDKEQPKPGDHKPEPVEENNSSAVSTLSSAEVKTNHSTPEPLAKESNAAEAVPSLAPSTPPTPAQADSSASSLPLPVSHPLPLEEKTDIRLPEGVEPEGDQGGKTPKKSEISTGQDHVDAAPGGNIDSHISTTTGHEDPNNTAQEARAGLPASSNDNNIPPKTEANLAEPIKKTESSLASADNQPTPNQQPKQIEKVNNATPPPVENTQSNSQQKVPPTTAVAPDVSPQGSESASDPKVTQYRKNLQERLKQAKTLPEAPKEEYISENGAGEEPGTSSGAVLAVKGSAAINKSSDSAASNYTPQGGNQELPADPKQLKFISDETQVLLLPNDDVVLGEVSQAARLDLMDFSSYVKIFWDNYNNIKDEPARLKIDNFIKEHSDNGPVPGPQQIRIAFMEALDAIERNNIYDLIALVDNYPILQLADSSGSTLLHKAVNKDNYSAVKLLLMKGVTITARNNKNMTALDIATARDNPGIATLLESAGAR